MKVALVGIAGSGKSTLANKLVDEQGYTKLSFAAPVKAIATIMLMRPIDKTNPLDREFLQQLGTDLGRKRDPQIWVKHFDVEYQDNVKLGVEKIVVDDVRFKNEADYLRAQGFMIVKITGRGYDLGSLGRHASETELDSIEPDWYLNNGDDIEGSFEMLKGYMIIELNARRHQSIEEGKR
jgi:hypothetical protein